MNPVQSAQDFLAYRLGELKKNFTTTQGAIDLAPYVVPNIGGKLGTAIGTSILKSAGEPGATRMGTLGLMGPAPVYDTPFNSQPVAKDNAKNASIGSYEARVQ